MSSYHPDYGAAFNHCYWFRAAEARLPLFASCHGVIGIFSRSTRLTLATLQPKARHIHAVRAVDGIAGDLRGVGAARRNRQQRLLISHQCAAAMLNQIPQMRPATAGVHMHVCACSCCALQLSMLQFWVSWIHSKTWNTYWIHAISYRCATSSGF
jgi:hypothetical protein